MEIFLPDSVQIPYKNFIKVKVLLIANLLINLCDRDKIFWAPRTAYGPDQGFLKRYLWPWGKWNAMSHDAYTCLQFSRTSPFPTRRKELVPNNFVAAVVEVDDVMRQECPEKCRPKEHKDWIYC